MMTITFSLSGISFILDAGMMGLFCYSRYRAYIGNRSNQITYYYFLASLFVSLALLTYGLPIFFSDDQGIMSIFGSTALVLNAIGFSNFFMIALYSRLSSRGFILAKHILYIFVCLLTIGLIVDIPPAFIDPLGIIHWRFGLLVGILAALHMDLAFAANVYLIMDHFYRLKKLSILNSIGLVTTFVITGIAGSYLYIGDSGLGLGLASIGLYAGISVVFFLALRGTISRFVWW